MHIFMAYEMVDLFNVPKYDEQINYTFLGYRFVTMILL